MTTTDTATQATAVLAKVTTTRAALAWVALVDAPTPIGIRLYSDHFEIDVETMEEFDAWVRLLGAEVRQPFVGSHDKTMHSAVANHGPWRVRVYVHLKTAAEVEPLEETTRKALTAVVGAR